MTFSDAIAVSMDKGKITQTDGSHIFLKSLEDTLDDSSSTLTLSSDASTNFQIIGTGTPQTLTFNGKIAGGAAVAGNNQTGAYILIDGNTTLTLAGNESTYDSRMFVGSGSKVIIKSGGSFGSRGENSSAFTYTGGAYEINSSSPVTLQKNFLLNGEGPTNAGGALVSSGTDHTIEGDLTFGWSATTPPVSPTISSINVVGTSSLKISGNISGSQPLIKNGDGTLILAGDTNNTYNQSITINSGSLQMDKDENVIAINGQITIDPDGKLENKNFSNQINNTTTTMIINGGKYDTHGNSEGMGQLIIRNGGELLNSGSTTLIGSPASIITLGGNETVLSLTGGSSIPAGFGITITSPSNHGNIESYSGPSSAIAAINLGNYLRKITVADSLTIADSYVTNSGDQSPGFIKLGPGTLLLSGEHTYVGSGGLTEVNEGTLSVNGTFSGNIKVSETTPTTYGTLQGVGSITGAVTLTDNAHIAPGNSIGTLTVYGDIVLGSNTSFDVELTPSPNDNDRLTVENGGGSGTVTINPGAILNLIPGPGTYPGTFDYTIISATGGVTGTFVVPPTTSATFINSVQYLGNEVHLKNTVNSFSSVLKQGNNGALATYWDGLTPPTGSPLSEFILQLRSGSADQLADASEQSSGADLKAFALSEQANAFHMRAKITNHNRRAAACRSFDQPEKPSQFWTDGGVDETRQDPVSGHNGFNTRTANIMVGLDHEASDNFLIGSALGYSRSSVDLMKGRGNGTINTGYLALYLHKDIPNFFFDIALVGGLSDHEEQRNLDFTLGSAPNATNYMAKPHSSFTSRELLAHVALGNVRKWGHFELSPFISMDYLFMNHDSFKEHGGGIFDLDIEESDYSMLRGEGGINFSLCIPQENYKTSLIGKASYIREQRFSGESFTSRYIDTNSQFTVNGISENRNLFAPALGIMVQSTDESQTFNIRYEGAFGSSYNRNGLNFEVIGRF